MLTIRRFRALASSYGTDLRRWPPELRRAAQELLEQSAQARAALAAEERLDSAIARTARREATRLERDPICAAALQALRLGVAAEIERLPERARHARARVSIPVWPDPRRPGFWRIGLATAACATVFAGFLIGTHYESPNRPGDLLAALSFNPMPSLVD